jgi:hypothetical protein
MTSPEDVSSSAKPLLDEPLLTATIDTGYTYLFSVCCLGENVWTLGDDKTIKLYNNPQDELLRTPTKSGIIPQDIAVTHDGGLAYTEYDTINLIRVGHLRTLITLKGWRPLQLCSTSIDELLVSMMSDNMEQSKVVRYSGLTEKQTIQFDDQGRPLYSSGRSGYHKYISENRNMDICVADNGASTVVVVDHSGKLRFRYTGRPSDTKNSFNPSGITTDSQSHILITDTS